MMAIRNFLEIFVFTSLVCSFCQSDPVNITSRPFYNDGVWGTLQRCPSNKFAQAFQLKTLSEKARMDNSALNAVKLFCGDPYHPETQVITSSQGLFGNWGRVYNCYPGVLNGFQYRQKNGQGVPGDDTGSNNIRFFCSRLPNPDDYIEGDGLEWGVWTEPQHCYGDQAICGIRTQIDNSGDGDEVMLNNILFECCDYDKYQRRNSSWLMTLVPVEKP